MTQNGTVIIPKNLTVFMYGERANQRKSMRDQMKKQLFPTNPNPYTGPPFDPADPIAQQQKQNQILSDLASSFSRYAGNQQTAFDTGASRSSAGNNASQMQQRVERTFAQVLGRSYGSSPVGFVNALNGAFPMTADGQKVVSTQSRSMLSLYGASDASGGMTAMNGYGIASPQTNSFMGQISARQAVLYRQASIVAADALQVLAGLTPFIPEADFEQVEALRVQINSEISALVDEFARVDEPRPERVRAYFDSLTLHVIEFGRRAFLDKLGLVATTQDEAQTANFELLKNYRDILRNIWDNFYDQDRSSSFFSLSERVDRASILLPIIARGNDDFEAAMDSVDFVESDRRSIATKFTELLDDPVSVPPLLRKVSFSMPDITVYDLTEWLDRFANFEGQNSLSASGQYGLNFVTDQADTLFWVIAPIVGHFQTTTPNLTGNSTLEQVFANERVEWSLNNLLTQLQTLADLAVPGAKKNVRVR
jgi:hypothetical protein